MYKSLSLLSLITLSLSGSLRFPEKLGKLNLLCHDDGFSVIKDKKLIDVSGDCMDSQLRKMDSEQRAKYVLNGGLLILNQANNGEYTLRTAANLKGGGLAGAAIGAKLGMFLTHFIGHGLILIASACTGPAMPATVLALEATFGGAIIVTGKAAAIAGGIIGGVSTGPV